MGTFAEVSGSLSGAAAAGLARPQFRLAETADLATEICFCRQVADSDPAALPVLLQDGAGFHLRDGDGRPPDNVRNVTLPPYSPELNPVEGLWDQLKDVLANRVFATLAELEAAIARWLQGFWADARRVRSLVFGWLHEGANASSGNIMPVI